MPANLLFRLRAYAATPPEEPFGHAALESRCRGDCLRALFHNAVEAFNRRALDAPEVRATVEGESEPRTIERRLREFLNLHCVDLNASALRSVAQQEAFIRAVGIYMGELADIIADARWK